MAITFKYGGASFTVDTPQQAADILALLKKREAEAAIDQERSSFSDYVQEAQHRIGANEESKFVWTPDLFNAFISRLGNPQKLALALLVKRRTVTDEELRNALRVSGNQALAGVLSGISKQGAALNILPRDIFNFENLRNAGKRRSTYIISDKFAEIASSMNWPRPAVRVQPSNSPDYA